MDAAIFKNLENISYYKYYENKYFKIYFIFSNINKRLYNCKAQFYFCPNV